MGGKLIGAEQLPGLIASGGCSPFSLGVREPEASALHLRAVLGGRAVPFPPRAQPSSGVLTFQAVSLQTFESQREGNDLKIALCSGEGQPPRRPHLPPRRQQHAPMPAWL